MPDMSSPDQNTTYNAEPEQERTPISFYFSDCISEFERLYQLLASGKCSLPAVYVEGKSGGVESSLGVEYKERLLRDLDSFRVWAGGCGAHRVKGKESLDYKLREALFVHDTATTLLRDLKEALEQGTDPNATSVYGHELFRCMLIGNHSP